MSRRVVLLLIMLVLPTMAQVQDLPLLPADEHPKWAAIGRVNIAGFRTRRACTGTLIAPRLVLTAAHCVIRPDGSAEPPGNIHYVAGWLRGAFIWHSPATAVRIHPRFDPGTTGPARAAADLAIVELAQRASPDVVRPVPLVSPFPDAAATHAIIGYQHTRAAMLSARMDCPLRGQAGVLRVLGCPVIPGLSGSPVLSQTADGWRVSAVVTARLASDPEPQALVVTPDTWVHEQVSGTDARLDQPMRDAQAGRKTVHRLCTHGAQVVHPPCTPFSRRR